MRYPDLRQHAFCAILAALLCSTPLAIAGDGQSQFETLDGESVALEEFTGQGRWLVVKIWASGCHVCNQTAHEMVALSEHRKHDVRVLGIAVDGRQNRSGVMAFIERHALNYETLIDDGRGAAYVYRRGVGENWGGWTPTYLIYSPQGELVARNIGAVAESDVTRFVDSYQSGSGRGR